MPHVVLKGNIEMENIFQSIKPIFIKDEKGILKTQNIYIDRPKKSVLFESLVLEEDKKIQFLGLISKREDGLVIRIYPALEIEKTDGVKKILAKMANNLLEEFPKLSIGETNLSEFLN